MRIGIPLQRRMLGIAAGSGQSVSLSYHWLQSEKEVSHLEGMQVSKENSEAGALMMS